MLGLKLRLLRALRAAIARLPWVMRAKLATVTESQAAIGQIHALLAANPALTMSDTLNIAVWTEAHGIPILWAELAKVIGRKSLKPLKAQEAIRGGLVVSFPSRAKLPTTARYYLAQMSMLDAELRRYCRNTVNLSGRPADGFTAVRVHGLHNRLTRWLGEAVVMLEAAHSELRGMRGVYGAWRRNAETSMEVYFAAEQATYGQFSGMTFVDLAPFAPTATLRTAIELRMRLAFGVLGYFDPCRLDAEPIALSRLFEVLRHYRNAIEFAVPLADIERVYRWSNPYLHSGWRDYPWVAGFVIRHLRPLFVGVDPPLGATSWSQHSGVRLGRPTWRAIQQPFIREAKKRKRQLMSVTEEQAECVFN